MKHNIVSFYGNDLPLEIIELQKKVFDFFGIDVEQIPFKDNTNNNRHADAIQEYLRDRKDWDSITFFDVDSIPITHDCISKAIEIISDDNTIYGNAQASNVFDVNPYKTPPFVAPSFLSFTRKLWEESNCKNFRFTHYPNPDGHITEVDVAEEFTRENEKQGRKIILSYPTKTITNTTWRYDGSFGYKPFEYGNGTEFESGTFHNFQIRVWDKQQVFIDYCKRLLNEN
jgi:hypothetical protein